MKRAGTNAKWNQLTPEQLEKMEGWLFEEELGFEEVEYRARMEMGFEGSVSSIKRFYARKSEERMVSDMLGSPGKVKEILAAGVSTEDLRAAGMKVVAQLFLNQVLHHPEQVKEWSRLARLLLQSEANEQRVRIKQEEHRLREKALEFAREKFHYDILEKGVKVLPQLRKLEEQGLTQFEKNKRQNDLRKSLFGPNIPELLPENEEEEKRMAAEKVIEDARRAEYHVWWEKKFGKQQSSMKEEMRARTAELRLMTVEEHEEEEERLKMENIEQTTSNTEPRVEVSKAEEIRRTLEVVVDGVVYPYGQ